eukprot:scaffold1503_cov120-Isochrysis_galbana.AAC.3
MSKLIYLECEQLKTVYFIVKNTTKELEIAAMPLQRALASSVSSLAHEACTRSIGLTQTGTPCTRRRGTGRPPRRRCCRGRFALDCRIDQSLRTVLPSTKRTRGQI